MARSKSIVTPEEFAAAARTGHAEGLSLRLATTMSPELGSLARVVRYIFSDASVGRDGFTIAQDGWILDDFLSNPVFLWGHDDLALPIGRVVDLGVVGGKLRGDVEYIAADLSPFADTVYRMVRGGYLNAVSTRWLPHTWRFSTDKARPGAIDFTTQELLEVSQVCVPGLATALAEARSAGIDTEPMFEWAGQVLDRGGMVMVQRSEIEELRKVSKMPKSPPRAADIVPETPAIMTSEVIPPVATPLRGLYEVGWLAMLLSDLGYLEECVEWEAAMEEDNSTVPAMLHAALQTLGAALVAMTIEEVGELIADEDEGESGDLSIAMAAKPGCRRAALRFAGSLLREQAEGRVVTIRSDNKVLGTMARAGRVFSADNERCLRDLHGHLEQARDLAGGMLDQVDEVDCEANPDDPACADQLAAARRVRRMRVARATAA